MAPTGRKRVINSIAVLPFRGHPATVLDQYSLHGFCYEIVSRISRLNDVRIKSLETTLSVELPPGSAVSFGRQQKVDAVLTGELTLGPQGLRLAMELADTRSGNVIWTFNRDGLGAAGILDRVDDVVQSLAESLRDLTDPDRANLRRRGTRVDAAARSYMEGIARGLYTNEEDALRIALAKFETALSLDPDYAEALGARAYGLWKRYFMGWEADRATLDEALRCAQRAIAIDPTTLMARTALVRIHWDLGSHVEALKEGRRCIEADPRSAESLIAMARAFNNAGMAERSIPLVHRALKIDPGNPTARKLLVFNYVMVERPRAAITVAKRYFEQYRGDSNAAWVVAIGYLRSGSPGEAVVEAQRGLTEDGSNYTLWQVLGYAYRAASDEESALKAWSDGAEATRARLDRFGTNYRTRAWLANLYAGAGMVQSALDEVRIIEDAEPNNAYLQYRLAHAYVELGRVNEALDALQNAVNNGFLSLQMMRCEEVAGLARIAGLESYGRIKRQLERQIEMIRRDYEVPDFG